MSWYGDYKPYVPVAQRRAEAAREVAKRVKKGQVVTPVRIEGRTIASTFWGQAWCTNLESYSDYANRLPRGRTYARNGSVVHLAIEPGRIKALVSGSSLYEIQIDIAAIPKASWLALKKQCAGQIGTLVELLQGKLSQAVMELVTDRDRGLFPKPKEITMRCSCPDGAGMCKHLAAVMYGVGNRLDASPELLFQLRGVNHAELIEQAIPAPPTRTGGKSPQIASTDLGAIFDIELDEAPVAKPAPQVRARPKTKELAANKVTQPTKTKAVADKPKMKEVAAPKVVQDPKSHAVAQPKPGSQAQAKPTAKKVAATKVPQAAPTPVVAQPKPAPKAREQVKTTAVAVKQVIPAAPTSVAKKTSRKPTLKK